jgi:N-acetylglucosaminyldiphosphoundecaprenol N-acetyl-beta-D-mannosaminyltransferase
MIVREMIGSCRDEIVSTDARLSRAIHGFFQFFYNRADFSGVRRVLFSSATINPPAVNLFGIPIAPVTLEQALDCVDRAIASRKRLAIGVVNAAKVVNMQSDRELREAVLSSDIVFADGMSVVWASRILRQPLPERVAGIDLMYGMLARGSQRKYRVYCLGATEEISMAVAAAIARDYPGVVLAGRRNGYFDAEQEAQVAQAIADSKADILLVAITSPKKERFMAKWGATMAVPVVHGVGGSFDVMAGLVERAPAIWQRMGLEWLYRVKQEPGRLWKRYFVTNSVFCWMLLKAVLHRALAREST